MALPKALKPSFTYADYLSWPSDERWELIDGEAYAKLPAENPLHQIVTGQLLNQIDNPTRTSLSRIDVLLPTSNEADEQSTTVVQPDVLVVCDPAKIAERNIRGAPDWIIEVLSPATARYDHITKRALYERAGVREYWLVHPVDRIITIYTLQDGHYAGPEIIEMAGERAPTIFPDMLIRWQTIVDKLPPIN